MQILSRLIVVVGACFFLSQELTAQQKESPAYVFSYFKGNGEDGLHLAYSLDGLNWTSLKKDSSFLKPTVAKDKLMRDPCIIRGKDGLFHMVWTVSWKDRGIGYANSKDLIHWSEQVFVPVMEKEPTAKNCWAPEIFYDDAKKEYLIYWATTIPGRFPETENLGDNNHRIYYVTTKDFKSFSNTKLLYDQGFNVIDASIQKAGKQYVMILKDETLKPVQKNLRVAFSNQASGGYGKPSAPITGNYWAEGPTALKIGQEWIVYFDKYRDHKYGAVKSKDLINWTDISDSVHFPKGLRHGTVLTICKAELELLKKEEAKLDADPAWASKVGANITGLKKNNYWVNDFGAKADSNFLSTTAIQKAIDVCAQKGGGVVSFKPGVYQTGSIFLKTGVTLNIDKNVLILGSTDFKDYPEIDTRIAGIEMKWPAALINIIGQKNAQITGKGTINARGKFCWDKYWAMRKEYEPKGLRWIVDYDAKRVRTILVQNAENIVVSNITLKNAGFWTVQLLYSTKITVDGIVVKNNEDGKGPSTDGIDVDSSTWVLIQNCDIDCNDDDFCLKSGRDWDGLRVNKPTEYVVIRNCIARKGGGLLTLGSETSGGIRHVLAKNLQGFGTGNGLHIKSAVTRGGIVEDIWFKDIQLDSVGNVFQFNMNWNPSYSYSALPAGYDPATVPAHWKTLLQKNEPASLGIPIFRNIHVSGVVAKHSRKFVTATGLKESALSGFYFDKLQIEVATAGEIRFAGNWIMSNLKLVAADKKPILVENAQNMKLE
jgi:hypothetical protein